MRREGELRIDAVVIVVTEKRQVIVVISGGYGAATVIISVIQANQLSINVFLGVIIN